MPQLQSQRAVLKGRSRMLAASDGSTDPQKKKRIIGVMFDYKMFGRLDVHIGSGIDFDSGRGIISLVSLERVQ
jgi:hypothetical protein